MGKVTIVRVWKPDYKKIKSEFIKEKIKEARGKISQYIEDLAYLECFILEGPKNFAGAKLYNNLKHRYPEEFLKIYKDLKPREFGTSPEVKEVRKYLKGIEECEKEHGKVKEQ